MLYQHFARPLLFRLTRHDPERAHTLLLALLAAAGHAPPLLRLLAHTWSVRHPALERTVCGIRFPNPVGLAAGWDKDGLALPALAALGFGHIEAGTVTWHAQPGNPRPRVFRLPASEALINRMGFNNQGAPALAARLRRAPPLPVPLGISLGKSRRTPPERAVHDYCASLRLLAPYARYIAVNVSSPNTPGLRALQERAHLEALIGALQRERQQMQAHGDPAPPLLLKVAPDLSEAALLDVLQVCADFAVSGIIATNTTTSRDGLREPIDEAGGLSGRPLRDVSRQIVAFLSRETGGRLPLIGVGGIFDADDARRMLEAGASLVQLYTGFIYRGPGLVRAINTALLPRR
jgi:dihydroorotate dehydrogenase